MFPRRGGADRGSRSSGSCNGNDGVMAETIPPVATVFVAIGSEMGTVNATPFCP